MSEIFYNNVVINAQTWEVSPLKNPVEPPKVVSAVGNLIQSKSSKTKWANNDKQFRQMR